jgi:hypothetical protein
MANSLETLERQRAEILRQMQQLGDMRRGSVVEQYLRCGKSPCCCKRPGHPGHGPYFALTGKVAGKTKTRQLRAGPVLEKARREVHAFHRFRKLSERLIQINEEICKDRRVEEQVVKKPHGHVPGGDRTGNRRLPSAGLAGSRQDAETIAGVAAFALADQRAFGNQVRQVPGCRRW